MFRGLPRKTKKQMIFTILLIISSTAMSTHESSSQNNLEDQPETMDPEDYYVKNIRKNSGYK